MRYVRNIVKMYFLNSFHDIPLQESKPELIMHSFKKKAPIVLCKADIVKFHKSSML